MQEPKEQVEGAVDKTTISQSEREALGEEWCEVIDKMGASELLEVLFYAVPSQQLREVIDTVESDYLNDRITRD